MSNMTIEELMQIKVKSASKISEPVREIPASIIVVNREDIERFGYTTLSEILINIPGFYHVYDYDEDIFGIRSIFGGEIALMINGIPQSTNQLKHMAFGVEMIERIEIIKGPMSVTHGNGAFLGSINIITLRNSEKIQASIGYGAENLSKVPNVQNMYKIYGGGTSLSDKIKVNAHASIFNTDGLNVNFSDVMSSRSLFFKAAIIYKREIPIISRLCVQIKPIGVSVPGTWISTPSVLFQR